jgi:hypothetical protein
MLALPLLLLACNASTGDTDTDTGTGESTDAGTGESTGESTGDASGSTGEPTTGAAGLHFATDVWPLFQNTCSCHTQMTPGVGGGGGSLFMGEDPATAYAAIVSVPSTVAGLDLIEPGDTAKSYLYHKVAGTQASVGGNGTSMPQGSTLPADQLATISAWIDAGALE